MSLATRLLSLTQAIAADIKTLFNTVSNIQSGRTVYEFTASASLTVIDATSTGNPAFAYNPDDVVVYVNGWRLRNVDFTATNGTTITLVNACDEDDDVIVETVYSITVQDIVSSTKLETIGKGTGTLATGKAAMLVRIVTETTTRVRLYSTSAGRTADQSRALGDPHDPTTGLIFEFMSSPSLLSTYTSPVPIAFNGDNPQESYVYYNVESASGTSPVTFEILTILS